MAALKLPSPDKAGALTALSEVGYIWYGLNFSQPVYLHEVARHDPDYWAIGWAGQGHLPQPIDVLPEYLQIKADQLDQAVSGLRAERTRQIGQLNKRLNHIAAVLEPLPAQIAAH